MNVIPYNSQVSIRDRRMNVLASNDVFSIMHSETYKKTMKDRAVYQTMVEILDCVDGTRLVIVVY